MSRIGVILLRVGAPVLVIVLAFGAAASLVKSKPKAKRAGRVLSAPLVEVAPASLGAQRVTLEANGTVRPAQLL